MNLTELSTLMQNAGVAGAGGAGFPSYAKLADGAEILVINCAECEPLMYTDYMLIREEMSKIAEGARIVMAVSGIKLAGRATQGVRLINIKEGDSIAAVSVVNKSDDETNEQDGVQTEAAVNAEQTPQEGQVNE
jgi:Na+-translocating ferredoxin:NAD+ oxidoreductase RnfC subunit